MAVDNSVCHKINNNAFNNCAQMPAALQMLQFYCKAQLRCRKQRLTACARAMGIKGLKEWQRFICSERRIKF